MQAGKGKVGVAPSLRLYSRLFSSTLFPINRIQTGILLVFWDQGKGRDPPLLYSENVKNYDNDT